MIELSSLVLYSEYDDRTAEFYRAVGVPLEPEQHDDGPRHHACEVAGIHVAVYATDTAGRAPNHRSSGSTFAGFYVDSLDDVAATLRTLSTPVLGDHERMPWGCRMIFADPDGRAVEINDRSHCPID